MRIGDRVDGGVGIGTPADVERRDAGLAAGVGDLALARLQRGRIAAVEHHVGARLGQAQRHAGAQSARRAGDQRDTALQ